MRPILPALLLTVGLLAPCVTTESARAADEYLLVVGRGFLGTGVRGPDGRTSGEAERIVVHVSDGRIAAVWTDTDADDLPAHLPRVEYPDGYLTPGLIAAANDIGGTHEGPESVGAGFRAADAFDRYGDYRPWLAAGVTAGHVAPGEHRLLSGQGAVVRFAGAPEGRVLDDRADLSLQLGDRADGPPDLIEFPFPPGSDVAIEPGRPQRPATRLGRLLGLDEALDAAFSLGEPASDYHALELRAAWDAQRPLRIAADRAVDLLAGVSFLGAREREGYLVGGAEIARVAPTLARAGIPVVYRAPTRPTGRTGDVGLGFDAVEADLPDFARLSDAGVRLVLGLPRGGAIPDLRFAAVLAHRAGLDRGAALGAITDRAAAVLGVGDRIGRVRVGLEADLVVWNTDPLSLGARPLEVLVSGRRAFRPGEETGVEHTATVVRAGTIWVAPGQMVRDGEVLIENGRVVAVGHAVSRPPHARVIDAGPDAFVTPGFIDARGHLGLRGDRGGVGLGDRYGPLIGVPDLPEDRVARAGITTVLLSPYSISGSGSLFSAVKTAGRTRESRVVRDVAAVAFEVGGDPLGVKQGIQRVLGRGKKYIEQWEKYEKALAEWEKKKAAGEETKPAESVEEVTETTEDPVTGVWAGTVSGGPLPEPQTGRISLRLTGNQIEGRVIDPPVPVEHRIVATLEGTRITGIIEADVDIPEMPTIEAELLGDDKLKGTVTVLAFQVDFTGERVSKEAVEYKVTRRRRAREDGKPLPPQVDPAMESVRALLEKKIPAVVKVDGRDRIAQILELFIDEEKLLVVLLDADEADAHAARLAKSEVGVITPVSVRTERRNRSILPSDTLSRGGVRIAFQSTAEDGARELPTRVLYAVDQGLSPDAAIAALTTDPARMFRLDDRIGSLEPGRDGDLLIFRGHPFREGGRLERVLILGEEVSR